MVSCYRAEGVKVAGVDLVGSAYNGLDVLESKGVEISGCRVLFNGRAGVQIHASEQLQLHNSLVAYNKLVGVGVDHSRNCKLSRNEIAFNFIDGLVISWQSSAITVESNYIHHHLWWRHPDNVQLYRDVRDIRFLDNLLVAGGQTVMMEEAQGLIFHGNVCVGSGANMLIFGHSNAGKALLEYNTFCFPGYSCLNFTASDYTVRHNVFVLGHKGFFFGLRGVKNYSGDYNLFWAAPQAEGGIATDKGWFGSFTAFKQANPELEVHSEYAEPQFKSAPVSFAVLDGKRLTENTHSKLYLRPGGGPFEAGDYVELDFDGRAHKVTRVRGDEITLEPALARLPLKEKLVVNWGKQPGFAWDLRLEATSPGWKLGKAGKACGAGLDMAAFQRCDFDGDGKREVPEYPKE